MFPYCRTLRGAAYGRVFGPPIQAQTSDAREMQAIYLIVGLKSWGMIDNASDPRDEYGNNKERIGLWLHKQKNREARI